MADELEHKIWPVTKCAQCPMTNVVEGVAMEGEDKLIVAHECLLVGMRLPRPLPETPPVGCPLRSQYSVLVKFSEEDLFG